MNEFGLDLGIEDGFQPINNYDSNIADMEIKAHANYLGITPEQFIAQTGLAKAGKPESIPGLAGDINPTRGFQNANHVFMTSARGIRERMPPTPFNALREMEKKVPVISAAVNTRCRQAKQFSKPSKDPKAGSPGYTIELVDIDSSPTSSEIAEMKFISEFFYCTGRTDFDGWDEREDNFPDFIQKIVRDYYTIDQIPVELQRDKSGKPVAFWALDGAHIKRVIEGGYGGHRADFDPRSYLVANDDFEKKLSQARLDLIPSDIQKIRFVQEIDGRLLAAFTRKDMIFDSHQKRTDIRYAGFGYPPIEQAITVVTAFLFGLAYNAESFNSGTIPKVALAFEQGNYTQDQLVQFQDQWLANFQGMYGAFRIPLLNGKVNAIDLMKSPRDMEYMKYLEFTGALILSIMGFDSAEIGLRFQQAQNVLSENVDSRMQFSKDRGLIDIMSQCETLCNKIMQAFGWFKYRFRFVGLTSDDRSQKLDFEAKEVQNKITVNELRAKSDMKPIKGGDIILNPTFLQNINSINQQEQQAQSGQDDSQDFPPSEGESSDYADELSDLTDEQLDEMFKARKYDPKKISMRTLIK